MPDFSGGFSGSSSFSGGCGDIDTGGYAGSRSGRKERTIAALRFFCVSVSTAAERLPEENVRLLSYVCSSGVCGSSPLFSFP